jgi:hypothetical protein
MYIDELINECILCSTNLNKLKLLVGLIAPITEIVIPVEMLRVVSYVHLYMPGSHSECRLQENKS